jgi:tetratricopeptide (TPR) repeat protein
VSSPRRYKAFISYSHADERPALWLQRALESYRLPKKLLSKRRHLPPRLYPIFRDRDELASATDLSESIQQAMASSEALIVVCSPAAAASQWVNEEIRRFQLAGHGRRIFCLLVAGSPEPGAVDCAFPPALLQGVDGQPVHEPLAADLRPGGDGKRNAMLKIAAGLLDVGVDELKRRDAQRQARLWSAVAIGSTAIALLTIGLAIAAVLARQESEIRRQQAENLIGFMLGDLRAKLEPIGKLDLLDAVGDQAMAYFAVLGQRGSPQEMLDRAKALRQIGDVRFNQGQLEPTARAFRQALAQTRALHEAAPDNNDYLFELGQAEFWVGYVAWQRNDLDQAHRSMQRYMALSRELRDRAPGNAAYRMELAYAHSNLGSVARAQGHLEQALAEFRQAARIEAQELAAKPGDASAVSDLADIWSWIGSTSLDLGRLPESEQAFAKAVDLMRGLHEQGSDPRKSGSYASLLLLQADALLRQGRRADATALLDAAQQVYDRLRTHDPGNASWRRASLMPAYYRVCMRPASEWDAETRRQLAAVAEGFTAMSAQDPTNQSLWEILAKVRRQQALGELAQGNAAAAIARAQQAKALLDKVLANKDAPMRVAAAAAEVEETLGLAHWQAGDPEQARRLWRTSLARLGPESDDDLPTLALRRLLAIDLGQADVDARLGARLAAAGFKDPRFDYAGAHARMAAGRQQARVAESSPHPAPAPVH